MFFLCLTIICQMHLQYQLHCQKEIESTNQLFYFLSS